MNNHTLKRALEQLRDLVDQGVEYPDAHTRVVAEFDLNQQQAQQLADAYGSL